MATSQEYYDMISPGAKAKAELEHFRPRGVRRLLIRNIKSFKKCCAPFQINLTQLTELAINYSNRSVPKYVLRKTNLDSN